MTQILAVTTAPIYILIAVGFVAVCSGLLSKADNQGLGRFVLYFWVPPLLFRAFAQRKLANVVNFLAWCTPAACAATPCPPA